MKKNIHAITGVCVEGRGGHGADRCLMAAAAGEVQAGHSARAMVSVASPWGRPSRQSTRRLLPRGSRGFTLIELMVVIVILGILAAVIAPRIIGRTDEAKVTEARVQIKNFETALKLYKLDNGRYPTTDQGLEALVSKPTVGVIPRNWRRGGYLENTKIPSDPWGNPYIYASPGLHGDYDILSLGADGARGGEGFDGDVESWNIK